MERIKTLETRNLCESAKNGGCGECQTSCQSACKTSCGVANQKCENEANKCLLAQKKIIEETVRVADGHLLHLHLNQVEAFTAETV